MAVVALSLAQAMSAAAITTARTCAAGTRSLDLTTDTPSIFNTRLTRMTVCSIGRGFASRRSPEELPLRLVSASELGVGAKSRALIGQTGPLGACGPV